MSVTIKDVAIAANVSIGTVDRVLHNRPYVKDEVRKRVLDEIERLRYIPNKNASLLSTGAKKTIGLISKSYPHFFWDELVEGAVAAASVLNLAGVILKVARAEEEATADEFEAILRDFCEEGVGFLLVAGRYSDSIVNIIKRCGIPMATVNVDIDSKALSQKRFFIGPDDERCGRIAAGLVMKMPHTENVAVFAHEKLVSTYIHERRVSSFCQELKRYHSNTRIVDVLECSINDGRSYAEHIMEYVSGRPVGAVYLSDGAMVDSPDMRLVNSDGSRPSVVAHELSPETRALLMDGVIDFSINQNPYFQGYEAVKNAYDSLSSDSVTENAFISADLRIITREIL